MNSGVYTITNIITNQIYVGCSYNFRTRLNNHRVELIKNNHDNSYLQYSWNKYGENNFKFELLVECEKEFLYSEEHYWCTVLNTHNKKCGYNLKLTHPHNKNITSKEISEKIRIKATGRKWSEEYKNLFRIQKLGKKRSKEHTIKSAEGKYKITYQYSIEGTFIKEWQSAKHIEKELGIKSSNISMCCNNLGHVLSAGMFRWSYNKMDELPPSKRKIKLKHSYIQKYSK